MEQNVANVEEVEQAVEEIVETTKPKISWGKIALVATGVGALVLGGIALVKKLKDGKKAKTEEVKEEETNDKDWTEKLEEVANEKSIDELAE